MDEPKIYPKCRVSLSADFDNKDTVEAFLEYFTLPRDKDMPMLGRTIQMLVSDAFENTTIQVTIFEDDVVSIRCYEKGGKLTLGNYYYAKNVDFIKILYMMFYSSPKKLSIFLGRKKYTSDLQIRIFYQDSKWFIETNNETARIKTFGDLKEVKRTILTEIIGV